MKTCCSHSSAENSKRPSKSGKPDARIYPSFLASIDGQDSPEKIFLGALEFCSNLRLLESDAPRLLPN
jgi:hypothetical protein